MEKLPFLVLSMCIFAFFFVLCCCYSFCFFFGWLRFRQIYDGYHFIHMKCTYNPVLCAVSYVVFHMIRFVSDSCMWLIWTFVRFTILLIAVFFAVAAEVYLVGLCCILVYTCKRYRYLIANVFISLYFFFHLKLSIYHLFFFLFYAIHFPYNKVHIHPFVNWKRGFNKSLYFLVLCCSFFLSAIIVMLFFFCFGPLFWYSLVSLENPVTLFRCSVHLFPKKRISSKLNWNSFEWRKSRMKKWKLCCSMTHKNMFYCKDLTFHFNFVEYSEEFLNES